MTEATVFTGSSFPEVRFSNGRTGRKDEGNQPKSTEDQQVGNIREINRLVYLRAHTERKYSRIFEVPN